MPKDSNSVLKSVTLEQISELLQEVLLNQKQQGKQFVLIEKRLDRVEERFARDIKLLIDRTELMQESLEEVRGAQNGIIEWMEQAKSQIEQLQQRAGVYSVADKLPNISQYKVSKKYAKSN